MGYQHLYDKSLEKLQKEARAIQESLQLLDDMVPSAEFPRSWIEFHRTLLESWVIAYQKDIYRLLNS